MQEVEATPKFAKELTFSDTPKKLSVPVDSSHQTYVEGRALGAVVGLEVGGAEGEAEGNALGIDVRFVEPEVGEYLSRNKEQ